MVEGVEKNVTGYDRAEFNICNNGFRSLYIL
ncbi:hypothetical protein FNP_2381 [Fusobacterium polymorphum ATCC 10953]|uniref:Uncharacterized protein n=1 Tax=Fusobacterium polymorphum ATCC 10953 TaxID=393480 RepID=A5TS94_FUSNP|nr:hypothetical protein FNP_2381 [Fusobacterium polymorphum ATCC 10953]